jgi:hypothetical protein
MSVPMIEVVEPTLVSEAGHCAALFRGLHEAAPDLAFRLWIDRRARLEQWAPPRAQLRPLFRRRWRKLQAFFLYRRLLASGAPIWVPTAGYFDLRALDLAAGRRIAPLRAFLYFHKLRMSEPRRRALAALAQRQPDLELFGTSEEIVARLKEAGFAQVRRILPVLAIGSAAAPAPGFRTLLAAGAARADKGFTHIVDLVERMALERSGLPIAVQTSGDHYGRYDERTLADLERLRRVSYPGLTLVSDTLDAQRYAGLFPGAVCLQPYAPAEYADKMSAVTFDALRAGAPIVTLSGTTMAGIVEQTGAGIVVSSPDPRTLLAAAGEAVKNYALLHERALAAGARYRPEASWAPLLERLRMIRA